MTRSYFLGYIQFPEFFNILNQKINEGLETNSKVKGFSTPAGDPSAALRNLRDLAKESGFETYSLKKIYSNYSKESITVSNVDPHPNALGHVLIAGGLYRIINEPQKTIVYEQE